jgi:hypothetical protein
MIGQSRGDFDEAKQMMKNLDAMDEVRQALATFSH